MLSNFGSSFAPSHEASILGGPRDEPDSKTAMATLKATLTREPYQTFVRAFGLSFEENGRIGGGYYADVFRASVVDEQKQKELFSGAGEVQKKEKIVVKIVDQGRCPKASNYVAEMAVSRKIQANPHPNLITILYLESFSNQFWLLMTDCGLHHLASFLATKCSRPKGRLPEGPVSADLFRQLASALDHLHSRLNVVHRDLKPENVMVAKEGTCGSNHNPKLTLKLIDFGFAALIQGPRESEEPEPALCISNKGTLDFMAPELLTPATFFYDAIKTDLYSLGALFYFILHGSAPFVVSKEAHLGSLFSLVEQYYRLKMNTKVDFPYKTSKDVQSLINSLLAPKPADRPSLKAVLVNLKKVVKEDLSKFKSPSTESF